MDEIYLTERLYVFMKKNNKLFERLVNLCSFNFLPLKNYTSINLTRITMETKLLFLIAFFLMITPQFSVQANDLIASVHYENAPVVERNQKQKMKKKYKLKYKNKKDKNRVARKGNFAVMLVFGVLLLALAIFLIITFWPFSFGFSILNFFVVLGTGIASIGGLALLTLVIIFTNKYSSKKYLDKQEKK
jgi:hypothetical protein